MFFLNSTKLKQLRKLKCVSNEIFMHELQTVLSEISNFSRRSRLFHLLCFPAFSFLRVSNEQNVEKRRPSEMVLLFNETE